jgi:uncharacterized protein (TIGR02118 family)
MKRVVVIYGPPEDASAFDAHYRDVHGKLVLKMPHLKQFQYSTGAVASSNPDRPAHLVAFLDYATQADLDASLASPEGKAAVDDLANFASGGVTILTVDIADT